MGDTKTTMDSPMTAEKAKAIEESMALAAAEELINASEKQQLASVIEQSKELAAMRPKTQEEELESLNRAVEESVIVESQAHAAMLEAEVPKSEQDEKAAVAQASDDSLQGEREAAQKLQSQFEAEANYQSVLEMQEVASVADAFEASTAQLQDKHDAKVAARAMRQEKVGLLQDIRADADVAREMQDTPVVA